MRKRVMKAREKDVPDKDDYFFQLKNRVEREREREEASKASSCHVQVHTCGVYDVVDEFLWVPKTHEQLHLGPILCYLFGER